MATSDAGDKPRPADEPEKKTDKDKPPPSPPPGKKGEAPDNLHRREDWFRKRSE